MFVIGCVEDNQPETQPIQPTIQPTQEKQYTQIFTSGTLTVEIYDDYGDFIDSYSESFSDLTFKDH